MNGDLQQVRTIVAGYKAAHLLEVDRLNGLAAVTLGTYAKRDLRVLADKEAKVAAEFGAVADLLDQLAGRWVPFPVGMYRFADAGVWAQDEDDGAIPDPTCARCGVESNHHDEDGCNAWLDGAA